MFNKEKKDVLFLCQFFYPEKITSATLPYDTAKKLAESGLKVGALVGYPKKYEKKLKTFEEIDNISIKRVKYLSLDKKNSISRLVSFFSLTLSMIFNLFEVAKYKNVIVYTNPPVLPVVAIIAKKIFKTKIIFVSYDVYPEIAVKLNVISEGSLIYKVMKCINHSLYKNVDVVVALSSEMKNYILKNRDIDQDKIKIIPNWHSNVDWESLDFIKVKDELKVISQNHSKIISYIGNLGKAQDIDTLLEIAKNLNADTAFIFVGSGEKKEVIIQNSKKTDNIYFFDYLIEENYLYALHISDAFFITLEQGLSGLCVPSKTYSYYSAAKPIFTILEDDMDIVKEITKNEIGFNFKLEDECEIAAKINDLLYDESFVMKAKTNAYNLFVEKYTTDIATEKYVDLFN